MLQPVTFSLSSLPVPLLGRRVPAGFPSPADDYLEGDIDLAAYLIARPAATFMLRVSGESMQGAGIMYGDMLVVDRIVTPASGHIVVAVCNGEMTVKRLFLSGTGGSRRAVLRAENRIITR